MCVFVCADMHTYNMHFFFPLERKLHATWALVIFPTIARTMPGTTKFSVITAEWTPQVGDRSLTMALQKLKQM